jgi:outer membrane protein assembly factor BamB
LSIKSIKKYVNPLLLSSLLLLNACSSITDLKADISDRIFGHEASDPPEELSEIKATANAKVLWQAKVSDAGGYAFTPVVEAGYAYVAAANGEVAKFDAITGKQLWSVNAGENLSSGVGVGGSLVLVCTQRGVVYAFDLAGKMQWKAKLSSEALSPPKYFDGLVIVRTGDSRIFGINASDGSRKWVYDRTSPALTLRSSAGVVVDSGVVYAGFAGGKLVAVRADNGKGLWEASVAQPKGVTEIERIADITSLPVVDGPLVYAVAYQGRVAAVDRTSGRVVWNREISSLTGLDAEDARIFVSHAIGSVYALDYATGKTYWRQAALKNRQLSTPVPMGSLVAVGDIEGYVHFLNREDGAIAARVKTNSSQIMPKMTLINSNTLLAQARDGGIYAIQVK